MDAGRLVPDEVVIGLVRERLSDDDCSDGFMLDGFPRTLAQGESLENMLHEMGRSVDHVISFEVADEELVLRITGRRTCGTCGAIYHLKYSPPPSPGVCKCGAEDLRQRDDDNEITVRKRLETYHTQTAPLISFYRSRGLLREVQGTGLSPDGVFAETKKILGY
jgi:adenylate kinase